MSRTTVLPAASRTSLLVALLMVLLAALSAPALATEAGGTEPAETGPAPSIDEIGTQNEVSQEHLPDESELPLFQRWLYVPLAVAGVLIVVALLFLYLTYQPRFAEERRSKRRR